MTWSSSLSTQPSNASARVINVLGDSHYPSSYIGRAHNNVISWCDEFTYVCVETWETEDMWKWSIRGDLDDYNNCNGGEYELRRGDNIHDISWKQNQSSRRSTTTSSALALLAFLFFLNVLQRSLDDNKQGPIVMTRTTTKLAVPRNDVTENKQVITSTRDNIYITKNENIFNKYLKLN